MQITHSLTGMDFAIIQLLFVWILWWVYLNPYRRNKCESFWFFTWTFWANWAGALKENRTWCVVQIMQGIRTVTSGFAVAYLYEGVQTPFLCNHKFLVPSQCLYGIFIFSIFQTWENTNFWLKKSYKIFARFENKEKQKTQSLYVSILTHVRNELGLLPNTMIDIKSVLVLLLVLRTNDEVFHW